MKRKIKSISIILTIIIVGGLSFLTMNLAKNSIANTPPSKPDNSLQEDESSRPPTKPENDNNSNQPPTKPEGDSNNNQPPTKTEGDNNNNQSSANSESDSNNNQPPTKPESDSNNNQSPTKPEGDNNSNQQFQGDVQKTDDNGIIAYYILFGIEGLIISILLIYLIMSKVNKKTIKETFNNTGKVIIYVILVVILTGTLTVLQGYLTKNVFAQNNKEQFQNNGNMQMPGGNSAANIEYTSATEVSGEETLTDSYTSTKSDENVILVKDGGNLTLDGATVDKSSGNSSNTENSEFYGVNAGLLVTKNSTATIKNTTISTNAKGSNAIFSTGENSKIYISDSNITTTGEASARGLDATYGGYIEADNVTVKTQGRFLCIACNR